MSSAENTGPSCFQGSHTAPTLCPMGTLDWLRMSGNYFGIVPRISAFCLSFLPLQKVPCSQGPVILDFLYTGSFPLVFSCLLFLLPATSLSGVFISSSQLGEIWKQVSMSS